MTSSMYEETLVWDDDFRARHKLLSCGDEAVLAPGWAWAGIEHGENKTRKPCLGPPSEGDSPSLPHAWEVTLKVFQAL